MAAATAEAQASTAAELKNEDELQGNSEFLPAGACHAATATEAANAAAPTVMKTALAAARNGATPDASDVADAAAA
ncbi:hypothetical protein, partial [Thioclava electrotropha]|uniref:hypothetical protein n=1 Tax=Thioclava electrotropha TaxID=1549850 RepID=UPI0023A9127E